MPTQEKAPKREMIKWKAAEDMAARLMTKWTGFAHSRRIGSGAYDKNDSFFSGDVCPNYPSLRHVFSVEVKATKNESKVTFIPKFIKEAYIQSLIDANVYKLPLLILIAKDVRYVCIEHKLYTFLLQEYEQFLRIKCQKIIPLTKSYFNTYFRFEENTDTTIELSPLLKKKKVLGKKMMKLPIYDSYNAVHKTDSSVDCLYLFKTDDFFDEIVYDYIITNRRALNLKELDISENTLRYALELPDAMAKHYDWLTISDFVKLYNSTKTAPNHIQYENVYEAVKAKVINSIEVESKVLIVCTPKTLDWRVTKRKNTRKNGNY